METPFGNPFGQENFPNLYPENLQDEVNESYTHDKVLPRVEGKDYQGEDPDDAYATEGTATSNGESK